MDTVTFTGNKAELLDLIRSVERSTFTIRHAASFDIAQYKELCPFCTTGQFASFRNLEQHLSNKHGKTIDSAAVVVDETSSAKEQEITKIIESLVKTLRASK